VSGYEISRPSQERAQQDARDWIAAVDECVSQLASKVDLTTICSIGVTSQVDTHVLVDNQLNPLLPALLWQDVRSSDEADALNDRLGEAGRLEGWGDTRLIDASNPVPRALWLARYEPEAWQASRWLLLPKDFVNAWLTGTVASDPLASFKITGVDAAYVPGIVHAPGLPGRLPPLRSPEEPVGVTNRIWHDIPAGTIVATATMDAFGNALGSGLHGPGDSMVIMGTSAIVGSVGVGGTSGSGVVNFAPYRGRYLHAGPTQSGGESLRWWARVTGRTLGEILEAAASAPVGSGGVVFAPHHLGVRAPLWDNEVRSWFIGMHAATGFVDLSRGVLEGVGYSVRELLEAVETAAGVVARRIVMSGGGSQSSLWCQIIADVSGRVVHRSVEKDTAVVGAAILAVSALNDTDPWQQAATIAQYDQVFEPDSVAQKWYDGAFELYKASYDALHDVHRRLRYLNKGQA
jgi:xylulokinase